MIPGVDTHAGYGKINWKLVASAGYRFMWNKSAEGNEPHKDDLTWQRNCAEAQANGLAAGVYFFPYPLPYGPGKPAGRHPLEQAERFAARVNGFGSEAGQLAPAVDAEWPPPEEWAQWGCTAPQISEWLREHCEAVTLLFGRLPIIYTYPHWWRTLAAGADVSWARRYMLWFADYSWPQEGHPVKGWTPPKLSWVKSTWDEWAVCQHSANGSLVRVPGIPACPVDRNVMRDEFTLERLAGRTIPPPAQSPPVSDSTPLFVAEGSDLSVHSALPPFSEPTPPYRAEGPTPIVRLMPETVQRCARCGLVSCDGDCPEAA